MQVNNAPFDIDENIQRSVALLKEYFSLLKENRKHTILAYNAGIGNFKKGKFDSKYWERYQRAHQDMQAVEQLAGDDSGDSDGPRSDFRFDQLCGSPSGRILPQHGKAENTGSGRKKATGKRKK